MKTIELKSKKVPSAICPYCMQGLGKEKEIEMKTSALLKAALESNVENRKGLSNIARAIKITAKIEEAENTGVTS